MLLAPFELHRPEALDDALELLAGLEDSVVYMGGTELLILMKLGMARPSHLVDCKRIPGLGELAVGDGRLEIGAAVTHRAVELDPSVATTLPVLAEMTRQVANVRVRNAGTLAGNLCFAEPHSDPATLLLALDARLEIARRGGSRTVPVGDFMAGPLQTTLEPGELVTRIVVPLPAAGSRTAYRRFAIKERPAVNVAVVLGASPRVVVGAVGPRPVRMPVVEEMLAQAEPEGRRATLAAAAAVEAYDDADSSAEYKRHLVRVLLDRALDTAR